METTTEERKNTIVQLPVTDLHPHPDNPRKNVGDVSELAASIKAQGIRQNLLVVPLGEGNGWRVVIGHRRLAAAKQAGLETVPCAVADLTARQQMELMIVENSQRRDLKPIEEADAYQGLLDLGDTKAQIAERTGRSAEYVRSRLKAASIPQSVRHEAIDFAQLSLSELAAIAEFDGDEDAQSGLARVAGTDDWNWTLERTRALRKARRWADEAMREVRRQHLGLMPEDVSIPEQYWNDPEGYEYRTRLAYTQGDFKTRLGELQAEEWWPKALLCRDGDDHIRFYTPDEPRKAEHEEDGKAARIRHEIELRRANDEVAMGFDATARSLRRSWLSKWMRGHRRTAGPAVDKAIGSLTLECLLGYGDTYLNLSIEPKRLIETYDTLAPKPLEKTDPDIHTIPDPDQLTQFRTRAGKDPKGQLMPLLLS